MLVGCVGLGVRERDRKIRGSEKDQPWGRHRVCLCLLLLLACAFMPAADLCLTRYHRRRHGHHEQDVHATLRVPCVVWDCGLLYAMDIRSLLCCFGDEASFFFIVPLTKRHASYTNTSTGKSSSSTRSSSSSRRSGRSRGRFYSPLLAVGREGGSAGGSAGRRIARRARQELPH